MKIMFCIQNGIALFYQNTRILLLDLNIVNKITDIKCSNGK